MNQKPFALARRDAENLSTEANHRSRQCELKASIVVFSCTYLRSQPMSALSYGRINNEEIMRSARLGRAKVHLDHWPLPQYLTPNVLELKWTSKTWLKKNCLQIFTISYNTYISVTVLCDDIWIVFQTIVELKCYRNLSTAVRNLSYYLNCFSISLNNKNTDEFLPFFCFTRSLIRAKKASSGQRCLVRSTARLFGNKNNLTMWMRE